MSNLTELASHRVEYRRELSNKAIRQQVKANTGFEVRRMDNFTLVALDAVNGLLEGRELEGELGLYGVAEYFSVELLQQLVATVNDDGDIRPIDFISTVGNAANYYVAKLFGINGPNLFIGASCNGENAIKMLATTDLSDGVIDYAIIVQWFESEALRGCCAKLVSFSTL